MVPLFVQPASFLVTSVSTDYRATVRHARDENTGYGCLPPVKVPGLSGINEYYL
jgi:hypothetical protein